MFTVNSESITTQINLSNTVSGMYLIKLTDHIQQKTFKIIKQ
ncbi:T9SS type A sorting domain-containing protein [Yeosuana sp.]